MDGNAVSQPLSETAQLSRPSNTVRFRSRMFRNRTHSLAKYVWPLGVKAFSRLVGYVLAQESVQAPNQEALDVDRKPA
jgi:hypothetical protein